MYGSNELSIGDPIGGFGETKRWRPFGAEGVAGPAPSPYYLENTGVIHFTGWITVTVQTAGSRSADCADQIITPPGCLNQETRRSKRSKRHRRIMENVCARPFKAKTHVGASNRRSGGGRLGIGGTAFGVEELRRFCRGRR